MRRAWERSFWVVFLAAAAAWSLVSTPAPRLTEAEARQHNNIAWNHYLAGRTDEGLRHVDLALQVLPEDPAARDTRGALLWQQGRWDAAAREFQRALAADPSNQLVHAHLAVTLVRLQRIPEARTHHAAAHAPDGPVLECGDACGLCHVFERSDFLSDARPTSGCRR